MFTAEIWKKAVGYETFEVSNLGRVKNTRLGIIKAQRKTHNGYLIVTLKGNGVKHTEYVHRLVAKAFIDNPKQFPSVNHIDENKENNCVNNLEWCSILYNNCFAGRAKRVGDHHKQNHSKCKQVKNLDTNEIYVSVREAGRQTGICSMSISACLSGKQKHAGGFRWGGWFDD